MSRPLRSFRNQRYILLEILTSGATDLHELSLRKIFQDALTQSFGLSHSGTYMDILFLSQISETSRVQADGKTYEVVIRIAGEDAQSFKGAIAAYSFSNTPSRSISGSVMFMAVLDDSGFLPALLASTHARLT